AAAHLLADVDLRPLRSRTARLHLGGHGPRGGSAARRVLALSLFLGVDEPLPIDTGTSAEAALPGVRVRVKFAGKLRDGYLLERVDSSDHLGPLATLQ